MITDMNAPTVPSAETKLFNMPPLTMREYDFFRKFRTTPMYRLMLSVAVMSASAAVFLVQGCAGMPRGVPSSFGSEYSLKEIYVRLIESKLENFDEIEDVAGDLFVRERNSAYTTYSGRFHSTTDKYMVSVKEVRVRAENPSDIVMVELNIHSGQCLRAMDVAREYGIDVMQLKGNFSDYFPSKDEVNFYSSITHEWGQVNFGFNRSVCLKSISIFKISP